MRSLSYRRPAAVRLGALLGVTALVLSACSSGSPTAAPTSAATSGTAATQAAPSVAPKTLEIAYLSFAAANSYDAPMLAAARAAAAAGNANVTVFDANLDPAQQTKQLQDAVASGKFDGILLQPLYGAGLLTDAKAAIAAKIAVGNIDQILGTDFTTANSQVDGL